DRLYPDGGRCIPLPSYAWQHERFWPASKRKPDDLPRGVHPLLGYHIQTAANRGMHCWQNTIGSGRVAFLRDGRVQGSMLLPAAAYVELALAAANEAVGEGEYGVRDLSFVKGMFIPEDRGQTIQSVLTTSPQGGEFQLFSQQSGQWV